MAGVQPLQPKFSHIRPDAGEFGPNLAHRNSAVATGRCRIPFFSVDDFFVQAKLRKIFSEKSFFLKNDFCRKYFTTEIILRRNKWSISTF
jgi:hypothetical protein